MLEQLVVLAEDIGVEFAVGEVEGNGGFVLEGNMYDGFSVIIIAVVPMGVVDKPGLVVESVLEMMDDERQHVMVG